MKNPIQFVDQNSSIRSLISRLCSPQCVLLIICTAASWALSPAARSACQQGCDTNADNTFLGEDALVSNTTGFSNTAIGNLALSSNTTGNGNTANGAFALLSNTIGLSNTATGVSALNDNTFGSFNTANGLNALSNNRTGNNNTAVGVATLVFNTVGDDNTATGALALESNTTGSDNTASGFQALFNDTVGFRNTAIGAAALLGNTTGDNNVALGFNAGSNLTTGNNNIDIFDPSIAGESNTIRIGRQRTQQTTFIAGISGATVPGGVGVIIDSSGHLGTITSSARYKQEIQPMDQASEAIFALRPVTFRYKHEVDADGIPQFGLVAEEVERVNPDLVVRDKEGKPYTVRYEAVNAMLLNEFLKAHRKVQEQNTEIEKLKVAMTELRSVLEEQAAKIQKMSMQIDATKAAPRLIANNE